jgi:hypothetical protein
VGAARDGGDVPGDGFGVVHGVQRTEAPQGFDHVGDRGQGGVDAVPSQEPVPGRAGSVPELPADVVAQFPGNGADPDDQRADPQFTRVQLRPLTRGPGTTPASCSSRPAASRPSSTVLAVPPLGRRGAANRESPMQLRQLW